MLSLPLSATILLCLSAHTSAAPQTSGSGSVAGQTMILRKRVPSFKSVDDWGIWAREHRESLQAKYGDSSFQKRAGTNL
jgi:cathepsin D